jgi:dolichol-phosphate mannosyltransferase
MLSTETWPQSAAQAWGVARRFQKFVVVGCIGLAANQGALYVLAGEAGVPLAAASPVAIALSMVVTFLLNETWTWHDRGGGRLGRRALWYAGINSGGLILNWGILLLLEDRGMHYLLANLFGAGVAAVWNFSLNNAITWRE